MTRNRLWMLGAAMTAISALSLAPARADNPKMIIYVSPAPLGVNPFLIMGKTGTETVAKKFGAKTRTYEPKDPTTRKQDIEAAVRDGADIVVVLGFEFGDIIPDVAAKNPNVKFLIVDQCVKDPGPNVYCSVFREYEGSYVVGAEAALTSKTGKVGTIAALDIPFLHRYADAYAEGAKAARPDVQISKMLVVGGENPFGDPVRAEQQTQAMLADGADRIYSAAGGGFGGIFKAAKEKGALAIGVDVNQCPLAPGAVLDNMEKRVDNALVQAVEGIVAGTQQHVVAYGLKEGGLSLTSLDEGLANSKCEIAKFPDVVKKAHDIAADIEAGKIKLEDPMMK